ncbi:MAG: 30S ribosomal protein S6 [Patescibacteria group bacterium]
MSDTTMPAAEAAVATESNELGSYEFAFHVLPTVAEGEVAGVFEDLKSLIAKAGGSATSEEAPQRFDLAYEIVKHLEGKNRKFNSAYFGWVRFTLAPEALEGLTEEIEADTRLLRYLIIRLTRVEEENPFNFHEALAKDDKKVTEVNAEEVIKAPQADDAPTEEGEKEAVDEKELDEALKKDEA